ncbi:MAG: DALR anticodon-binding domain-containing protein, partial [Oscillospiraceae bacterium]
LLEMVPVDAARFFFNDRDLGATVDFDLDLAVKQSSENPVYYVQYAPARISSILKKAAEEGVKLKDPTPEELAILTEPDEVELIRGIAKFPGVIVGVVARYDTASLTRYATELANLFHKFYTRCRVVGNEDGRLTNARLALCTATRTTLTNLLGMLKITAPESM